MESLPSQHSYHTLIIGAGAAGLFCAAQAGRRGRKVLLIDKAKKPGEKIRISGGGRCNFTNIHTSPANYLSQNPHFCKSALGRYSPQDFIALVEKHGIAYHEKTLGQLFCDGSSKQIIQMLLDECEAAGVDIQLETELTAVEKRENGFQATTHSGQKLHCHSLVVATGGLSIPKLGATGWGYDLARQFDLNIIQPRAGLVPFTLSEEDLATLKPLAGVALPSTAQAQDGTCFEEAMLFTHRGLSGPSILQISSYWQEGEAVTLNLLPHDCVLAALKQQRETHPKQEVHTALQTLLPKRVAQYFCEHYDVTGKLAELSNSKLEALAERIHGWAITPNGTEGYRTAEVTLGGVDTDEVSSKSFEAKKVPGLYFIGEVLDVTGHLGGYNFQWAWASAHAAAQAV